MDLQKHLSGVNSPSIASPSCEIKSELSFPPLPASIQVQQQPQSAPPQSQPESAKVTPKISELSVLEEQLSKIHQKPFTQPAQQQSPHPSYSEAVRQSPTTVQQQFPPQTVAPQVQSAPQQASIAVNASPSPVMTTTTQNQNQPASAQKVSRFQVSKVEEQKAAVPQQHQLKPLPSPEVEVQNVQVIQQVQPIQPSQAQAFFQQHQGGVVSRISLCPCSMFVFPLLNVFSAKEENLFYARIVFLRYL